MSCPEQSAYAPDYGPRPVLVVFPTGKPSFSVLYMEALDKYGHLVNANTLVHAYRRAGVSFRDSMMQTFWILRDEAIIKPGGGMKRKHDEVQ